MTEYEDIPIADRLKEWLEEEWKCDCDSDVGYRCYNCCRYQDIRDAIKAIDRWKCIGCGCEFPRSEYDEGVEWCSSCAKYQQCLGRLKEVHSALSSVAEERNDFEGPSLDYMQGYRDGQKHLQDIAREAL